MKKLIALTLMLSGCVPIAFHPFFTQDDTSFDPAMPGVWTDEEGQARWVITVEEDRTLRIEQENQEVISAVYSARGIMHSGIALLDIGLEDLPDDETAWVGIHCMPGHTLSRIDSKGDTLLIRMLDQEWLEDRLESGALDTPYLMIDDRIVLTGTTPQLRALAIAIADSVDAFQLDSTLIRKVE